MAGGMSSVRKDLGCLGTGCRVHEMAPSNPFYGGSGDKIKRTSMYMHCSPVRYCYGLNVCACPTLLSSVDILMLNAMILGCGACRMWLDHEGGAS